MEKLKYNVRTLDDQIIKDGLISIRTLDGFPFSKNLYSIVGGIATQSYIHSLFRRPTSDIDLLIGRPLNYEDFKQFSKPVIEYLKDNGFKVNTSKRSRSFHLILENPKTNEGLLVEFSRRNPESFENSRKRIEREIENSRIKKLEGEKDYIYKVCSPEDILTPKLVRSINSLKRNKLLEEYLMSYIKETQFSDNFIQNKLEEISNLRNEASLNIGDENLAEELRFISDIYDVVLLSKTAGINEKYFKEAQKDWETLNKECNEKELIFRNLIPANSF